MTITESRNPNARELDSLSVRDILQIMNDEDKLVADAVELVLDDVARAIELVVGSLKSGGRLIYAGAGTSGRLALLDAAECPPTFGTPPDLVQVLMAGGVSAVERAQEGTEDDYELGMEDARARGINANDAVVGISASGSARYVMGVLGYAKSVGASIIGLTCNPSSSIRDMVDVSIAPIVGPEVIMGSSRLKAGTAQKMVLNMISTASMVRLGRIYQDLMIELRPVNAKLTRRVKKIASIAADIDEDAATRYIEQANGDLKLAVIMAKTGLDLEEARVRLARAGSSVRAALEKEFTKSGGEC
ncbi:MAG: N-acetylmuramic acid 6-phosphate etherase [Clostridia bacterium]|nr:N-acetylmuramic acid 6-phosphate etherase [Clostridia bacterium]